MVPVEYTLVTKRFEDVVVVKNPSIDISEGLCPEDVYVGPEVPSGIHGSQVQCQVDFQEMMGNEIVCHLTTNVTWRRKS